VLGCTEYELAAGLIGTALPAAALFRSAAAVAAQTLRRAGADVTGARQRGGPRRTGTVRVLLSGRQARLPDAALRYPEGRLLAGLAAAAPRAAGERADDGRVLAARGNADRSRPGTSPSVPA
jgi:glutamate racemase